MVAPSRHPADSYAIWESDAVCAQTVDQVTAGGPARIEQLSGDAYRLPGFAVAVLTLP